MTKAEFIDILRDRLSHLPEFEIEKSLSFYAGSIEDRMEDGMSEEAAVAALGDIDAIVQNIETDMPLSTLVKTRIKDSRAKSSNKTLWMVLAICGFPIWFPLGMAFAVVIFTVYLCVWVVILCFYVALASLAIAGVAGIAAGVLRGMMLNPAVGFFSIGAAISCIGLLFMCVHPVNNLVKAMIRFTGSFLKWIKGLFLSEKGVA